MNNFLGGNGGGFGGENVHDSLKALEEVRQDAEKGMFMFDGAIRLLHRQEEDCLRSGACSVCHRKFTTKRQLQECSESLQLKKNTVMRVRNEEAVALHDTCVQAMTDLRRGNNHVLTNLTTSLTSSSSQQQRTASGSYQTGSTSKTPSASRLAFYLRTGELSEWRQQKLDCMTSMRCFACFRTFSAEEFSSFLRRVDHRAAVMERELHVHPKFCPVTATPSITSTASSTCSIIPDYADGSAPHVTEDDKSTTASAFASMMANSSISGSVGTTSTTLHVQDITAAPNKRARYTSEDYAASRVLEKASEIKEKASEIKEHVMLADVSDGGSSSSSDTSSTPGNMNSDRRRELFI